MTLGCSSARSAAREIVGAAAAGCESQRSCPTRRLNARTTLPRDNVRLSCCAELPSRRFFKKLVSAFCRTKSSSSRVATGASTPYSVRWSLSASASTASRRRCSLCAASSSSSASSSSEDMSSSAGCSTNAAISCDAAGISTSRWKNCSRTARRVSTSAGSRLLPSQTLGGSAGSARTSACAGPDPATRARAWRRLTKSL